MKHVFEANRFSHRKLPTGVFCLMLAIATGMGCGKSKKTETPVPPPTVDNSAATPTANPTPANQTQPTPPHASSSLEGSPNGPTQLQSLNRALLGWKRQNHRQPKSFEEFASTVGFQIPAPPAGKKYSLNANGFIVLVNSN